MVLVGQYLAPAGLLRLVLGRFDDRFLVGNDVIPHFAGDDGRRLEVDLLVDVGHETVGHQLFDDVDRTHAHQGRQFAHGHKRRNLD